MSSGVQTLLCEHTTAYLSKHYQWI